MRSSDFMAALPEAVQRCLGEDLRLKRGRMATLVRVLHPIYQALTDSVCKT